MPKFDPWEKYHFIKPENKFPSLSINDLNEKIHRYERFAREFVNYNDSINAVCLLKASTEIRKVVIERKHCGLKHSNIYIV